MEADWLSSSKGRKVKLFYFTKSEFVLDNLKNRWIKVSNFAKCNDLFELAAVDLRFSRARKAHNDWTKRLDRTIGLICFVVDWKNPLMWAHYAENGKGACFVFEANWDRVWPVKYTSIREMPRANFIFPDDPASAEFRNLVTTKFVDWSYENEVRFIVDLESECKPANRSNEAGSEGLRFFPFGDDLKLIGIIKGPKSSLKEGQVKAIDHRCHFSASKLANQTFRMLPVRRPKLKATDK